jgi:hypothetical protein
MSKLRCHISISLDGFVAGPNQSEENPLGEGARLLDNLGDAEVRLEQVRAVEAPGITHLKYRVVT